MSLLVSMFFYTLFYYLFYIFFSFIFFVAALGPEVAIWARDVEVPPTASHTMRTSSPTVVVANAVGNRPVDDRLISGHGTR